MTAAQISLAEKAISNNSPVKFQLNEVSLRYAGASVNTHSNIASAQKALEQALKFEKWTSFSKSQ